MSRYDYAQRTAPLYNSKRRQASWCATIQRALLYTAIATIAIFVGIQLFTKVYSPYMRHWTDCADLYNESLVQLNDPLSLCADTDEHRRLRLKVKKNYDSCGRAQAVVDSMPFWMAFGRLMDDYDFCKDSCFQLKLDPLSAIGIMFIVFVIGTVLLFVLILGAGFIYVYRQLEMKYELPYHVPMLHTAANCNPKAQHVANNYPPQTESASDSYRHKNE